MAESICVLEKPAHATSKRERRQLASRKSIVDALGHSARRQVWVLPTARTVGELIRALSVVVPGVRSARLISYVRPAPGTARVLESGFERVLLGAPTMVPRADLEEILAAEHSEDYCIAAEWDEESGVLALWLGDLSVLVVPMETFTARRGVAPDPSDLEVIDCGQTVRMGTYEVSVDAVLFARDPEYRRRAKKRMVQEEQGLGASIRRLRVARRVARHDFPGLDTKTLARIERGDVRRPHARTLTAIAARLGVDVADLGEF